MEDLAACSFLNATGGLCEGACRACADGNVGAFASEFFRDGAAESFAGGCDDSNAPCEP